MAPLLQERKTGIEQAAAEWFAEGPGGYWYPVENGTPLVRLHIGDGIYRIDRRRSATTEWLPLVEGIASDFDVESFQMWARSWPLTA